MNQLIHVLILLTIINGINNKSLLLSYRYKVLVLCLGKNKGVYRTYIDTVAQHSFFFETNGYNKSVISPQYQNQTEVSFTYENNSYSGTPTDDIFSFETDNNEPFGFSFLLVTKEKQSLIFQGILALPFKFNDEKYSLIHQLKYKGIIDHLSFSIIHNNNKTLLNIGFIPIEYTKNKYHSYCDVSGRNFKWECLITEATIRNEEAFLNYSVNNDNDKHHVYFDNMSDNIYVPFTFYYQIIETFYRKLIDSLQCIYRDKYVTKQLICLDVNSAKIANMTFGIGEYRYTIDFSSLWYCGDFCFFLVYGSENEREWRFGNRFTNHFTMLFNYEDKRVNFYSNNGVEEIEGIASALNKTSYLNRLLLIVIIFSLAIGICIITANIKRVFYN